MQSILQERPATQAGLHRCRVRLSRVPRIRHGVAKKALLPAITQQP